MGAHVAADGIHRYLMPEQWERERAAKEAAEKAAAEAAAAAEAEKAAKRKQAAADRQQNKAACALD